MRILNSSCFNLLPKGDECKNGLKTSFIVFIIWFFDIPIECAE